MQHGLLTAWGKLQGHGLWSDTKFIGTEHKPCDDDHKPAESSFAGKTEFKVA